MVIVRIYLDDWCGKEYDMVKNRMIFVSMVSKL